MKANAIPILAIFGAKMRLEVPLFQRQYVWNREQQWAPLWEDISRKFTEYLEGRREAPVHFLGAMVLDQKQTPITHVEKRQIIDGQQRLTTLQIFLAAFRDFCAARQCSELANECEGFTLNKGMMADPEVERFKVWPTQVDRAQFADVIQSFSREELTKRYPIVKRKYSRKPDPRPRMVEAYLFFYEQLEEFFLGRPGDPPIAASTNLADRLVEGFQALRTALQVVAIDLEPGDDAQVIFETLNARGEPLLPADLLRNYIFLRAARRGEQQEALYKQYWSRFDDPFWRVPVQQGRLLRPRSDLFMQHFLASRRTIEIPIRHLFVEYKFWIEKDNPFASVKDELATLSKQGADFGRLLEPKRGDALYQIATFLHSFDIGTAYPALLTLLDLGVDDAQLNGISSSFESYLLRRAVCGMTTKNYNRIFLNLAKRLRKDGAHPQVVTSFLSEQTGDSSEWPSDDSFREAWRTGHAYQVLNNQKIVYILKRLNAFMVSKKMEAIPIENALTVEHILPQKWITHWPLPDGKKGVEQANLRDLDQDDNVAIATRRRSSSLQTFGNLTLLTQPLNSSVSNSSWAVKRAELKNSLLPINQELRDLLVWDEAAISKRADEMFARALSLWPRNSAAS